MGGRTDRAARRREVIAKLLASAEPNAEEQAALARVAARLDWVDRTSAAWYEAQKAADAAWMELVALYEHEEDIPELDPPPEQALVDRLWKQLDDIRQHDRWPRHLHWSL